MDELKRPRQVLMERKKVGPSDSKSARGWRGSVKARWWSERR